MAENSSIPVVGEGHVPPPCLMKAEVSWMSTVRGNLSYEERILRRVKRYIKQTESGEIHISEKPTH
ncbi:hypothetical protein MKX01_009598 [Papaver californicum]|nr:hypothetical protein MKX01_009598 [Papaver californicum]